MGSLTVTKDAEPSLNIDGNMISFEQFKEEMLSQDKPQKEDMVCTLENKLKKYESKYHMPSEEFYNNIVGTPSEDTIDFLDWSILYRGYCILTGKKNDPV